MFLTMSPTFPLKVVLKVNERYLRLLGIVLSTATGYKHPSVEQTVTNARKEDVNY